MKRNTQDRFVCLHTPGAALPWKRCFHLFLCVFRNRMCGRCTRSDAGTSSLLETASGSSMRINSGNALQRFTCVWGRREKTRREVPLQMKWLFISYFCPSCAQTMHTWLHCWSGILTDNIREIWRKSRAFFLKNSPLNTLHGLSYVKYA